MASKVTIDVEARFVDHVSGGTGPAKKSIGDLGKESDKTKKKVDELSKKTAKPIFDADDNRFLKKIRAAEEKMRNLGHKKTAAVLDVIDKGTVKIGNLTNKVQAFARKTWQSVLKFKDSEALSTINKVTQAGQAFARKTWTSLVKVKDAALSPIKAIKNALFSIPTLIQTVIAATVVKKAIIEPINLADQYSGAKIGFSTLLGESEGQAMMDKIDAFAKKTPFKTSGVISNVQKMMAMGWDVERVIDDLETIGDAAAATGKGDAGLESITRALAEIRSKGKLSTQELNQLAGAGIKAKGYLAQGLGYGTSDEGLRKLAEDLEKGAIGANQAIDLILQGMEEFDGMMDRTANETVSGLKSQLEDVFEINIARRWGQGLQEGARRGIGSVVSLLDDAQDALEGFGDTVYEVGAKVSNWSANKLEGVVKKIQEVTGTYEFKNADLGKKISMLWKGVIKDPLKEWWNSGGKQKTAKAAEKMGKLIGSTLSTTLKAVFGMTDVLKEGGMDESAGASVAQSFAKGFVDNFDVSGITDKFVAAIKNVWNALPWWAKLYIGGRAVSGIGHMVGGISNFVGSAGFTSATNYLYGGLSSLGLLVAGGKSAAPFASQGATAGLGLATVGDLLLAYKGTTNLVDSAVHWKNGEKREAGADLVRGVGTWGGLLGGGAIGAKVGAGAGSIVGLPGTVVGGIAGALIGGIVGAFGGDYFARKIEAGKWDHEGLKKAIEDGDEEAANVEYEKALIANAKKFFGDIELTKAEIERLAEQVVWGDDLAKFEKFSSATQSALQNLQNMKSASEEADRWMWKASLGVKFNEDERESIQATIDEYINSAKTVLENKHYEFTTSVDLLMDVETEMGKAIIEGGNAFYLGEKTKLDELGTELSNVVSRALTDGVISTEDTLKIKIDGVEIELNEQEAINQLQAKISGITSKIAQAEADASKKLLEMKWGNGNLTKGSYDAFMEQSSGMAKSKIEALDTAKLSALTALEIMYPEGGAEYDEQYKALQEGYDQQLKSLTLEIMASNAKIINDAYTKKFGSGAASGMIQAARDINGGTYENADELSNHSLSLYLGVDEAKFEGETGDNVRLLIQSLADQLGLGLDGDALIYETVCGVKIWAEPEIVETANLLKSDFGVPDSQAYNIALLLTGDKEILKKIDTATLAEELGVPEDVAEDIIVKLKGTKDIEKRVKILEEDLLENDSIWADVVVNIRAKIGDVVSGVKKIFGGKNEKKFRGGIVGYSDGGMVRGGSQLIEVAEEGSPEMIIPLSSQRRGRALKLWAQAGNIMGVPGFARGGIVGGGQDEGIRFNGYSSNDSPSGGQTVQVDVGGITFEINVTGNDSQSIVEAIKAQASELAETVAGVLADSLGAQFENTPARGGVS